MGAWKQLAPSLAGSSASASADLAETLETTPARHPYFSKEPADAVISIPWLWPRQLEHLLHKRMLVRGAWPWVTDCWATDRPPFI